MTPEKGKRYSAKGFSFDVHDVIDGRVYYRKWKPDVKSMWLFGALCQMSVEKWEKEMPDDATIEEHEPEIDVL